MNDSVLIDALRKRDKVAFDFVFNFYYSSLCVFSLQYLKDNETAEDIVQDMFVSLWSDGPDLHIDKSLRGFLFTAVKNRCFDYLKHQKVVNKFKSFGLLSEYFENSTDSYLAETELRHVIDKSLEKLSPRCREIFKLSRMNGMSNKNISEKLGISKRTVELQISNSLRILRKELVDFVSALVILLLLG